MPSKQTSTDADNAEILELGRRLALQPNLRRAFERAMTAQELEAANLKFDAADLLDYWSKTRNIGVELAVVQLAYHADMLMPAKYERLSERYASRKTSRKTQKPHFDEIGRLTFQGQQIGEFRLQSTVTRPVMVLRAFQTARWAQKVDSPLGKNKAALRSALAYTNKRIERISFAVHEDGKSMSWKER